MTGFLQTLLAFGFANLPMLGWLAAAAVPLVIHLWSRRKHREAPWAAIEFLLAAIRKNARRMQFEQWLLLAVRTLIILLVVLAVAEPYAQQFGVFGPTYRQTHRVFVLDGSYSMAYQQSDETLFNRARQMIAEIVEASRPGDAFSLVLVGEPSRSIVQTASRSPSDFLDELDSIQQLHTGGDLHGALTLAEEAIGRVSEASTPIETHEVIILSDLGRTSWQPDQTAPTRAPLGEKLQQLADRAGVLILDVGQENTANAAVTSLAIDQPSVVARKPVTFTSVIRSFGSQARPQTLVEFEVDGEPVETRRVNLPADGSVTVSFGHTFDQPGSHTATIRLARDFLALDDARHVAFEVKDHLRVLLIAGKRGATNYLAHALDPDPSDAGVVETKTVSEIALAETELNGYDCVILANIAQFTGGEARILERYLRQGGGLVIFLGDQVLPEVYNDVLASAANSNEDANQEVPAILPVTIGDVVSGQAVNFDPIDYRHPIVAPFRGSSNAGLLSTPVHVYWRLAIPESRPEVQIALAFPAGDPAMVTSPAHRGRVVVVATDGSLSSVDASSGQPWTYWPAWPSFLPIVREMLNFSVIGNFEKFNGMVGQPLGGALDVGSTSLMEVSRPDGGSDTVRVEDTDGGPAWRYDATDLGGLYRVRQAGGIESGLAIAVNLDTRESDLARADAAELSRHATVRSTWQDLQQPDLGALVGRERVHRWLLTAAIGLMLCESLLAQRFSRGAR
jgi:hypothetical protein